MTTKRNYEKPTMQVIELKQRPRLLNASGEKQDYQPEAW